MPFACPQGVPQVCTSGCDSLLACLGTLGCPNLWGHHWCREIIWTRATFGFFHLLPAASPCPHPAHFHSQFLCHQRTCSPHTLWNPGWCSSTQQSVNSFFFLLPNPWDHITAFLFSCLDALFLQSICALSSQPARADLMSWNSLIAAQAEFWDHLEGLKQLHYCSCIPNPSFSTALFIQNQLNSQIVLLLFGCNFFLIYIIL